MNTQTKRATTYLPGETRIDSLIITTKNPIVYEWIWNKQENTMYLSCKLGTF